MRQLLGILFLLMVLIEGTSATVIAEIYKADGVTPFNSTQSIAIGTQLVLKVHSDTNKPWNGSLVIFSEDWSLGELSARSPLLVGDWSGSHLAAAGSQAMVTDLKDSDIDGFDMYTGSHPSAGNWFILDYLAKDAGTVEIVYYENFAMDPSYTLPITQVPEPATMLLLGVGGLLLSRKK